MSGSKKSIIEETQKEHTASMEDYLETIAMLARKGKVVRVTQISNSMGVTKPSVTFALKKLSDEGLVRHEKYGYVELTPAGKKVAEDVFRRHEALRHFMVEILGIDPDVATEDACKMEHFLSQPSLQRLAKFVEFVSTCPAGEPMWLQGFNHFFEHGERDPDMLTRCRSESR